MPRDRVDRLIGSMKISSFTSSLISSMVIVNWRPRVIHNDKCAARICINMLIRLELSIVVCCTAFEIWFLVVVSMKMAFLSWSHIHINYIECGPFIHRLGRRLEVSERRLLSLFVCFFARVSPYHSINTQD